MLNGYQPPSDQTLRWVERSLGSNTRVLRTSRLSGGLTADMDRLVVRTGSSTYDVVLRRWSSGADWTVGLVERESAGLEALADYDLPVPRLLAGDESGDLAGVRCLLMTAVAGEPVLAPSDLHDWLRQLATILVHIHAVPANLDYVNSSRFDEEADRSWIDEPVLARALTEAAASPDHEHQRVLVHGDFQHFNVLWNDQQLSGVIDWTFVGRGPRGLDVGHCRLNLAVLFSAEAAEYFLRCYEAEAGLRVDPHADIRSLLSFDPSWQNFIPVQVAGRAPVDPPGMAGRVRTVLRSAAARLG